ncbi:MAG: DUF1178 family protein [Pseudomonadota bacterium]
MIQFTLKCDNDHRFDSWFASGAAFEKLCAAGLVECPVCGSSAVEKALMAPRVQSGKEGPLPAAQGPLTAAPSPAEQAMAEMRRKIEENSDYVGMNFAQEARDIHNGDAPERAIYGEAKPTEAKALLEDGVPVAPLPFVPGRKTN